MPRVAQGRAPAEPSSPGQIARYRRILSAAAAHGAEQGFDRVQMHDIAKEAGVAIGTLYRYFPSKTVLFTSLLHSQVGRLDVTIEDPRPGQSPAEAVADVLITAGEQLMRQPLLAQAMFQANNATVAGDSVGPPVTSAFMGVILRVGGVTVPTAHDLRLVRLIAQTWYGVLISQLNKLVDAEAAEADTRLACELLLSGLGADGPSRNSR